MAEVLSIAKKGVEHGLHLGADQVEVYAIIRRQARIEVRKSHVIGGDVLEIGGAAVRVYVGRSLGIASTTRLTKLEGVVERAYHLAKAAPEDPYFKSLPGPSVYKPVEGLYDKGLASLSFEVLTERFMEGVDVASQGGALTVSGRLTKDVTKGFIVNSLGVEALYHETAISGAIMSRAERDGDTAVGSEPLLGRSLREFDPIMAGREAAEKAEVRLGARKVATATMDVILDFRSTRDTFLSVLGLGANGLNVALGVSFLSNKIGDSVCPPGLTVVDDPTIPGGLNSRSFDDEGAPSTRVTIVEKGVLKSFITDSYSAGRLGVTNTGHARRRSLTSRPTPSLTNIHIAPGDWGVEELISETNRGVLVEDGRLGVSGFSTNISSLVDYGFYIEKGEIVHPVKNTMVGMTVFDLLANIDAITKEVLMEAGSSSPAVRIAKVRIAGGR